MAAGAKEALADVANGVASGKKALVSGYHDATGDQAVNEELAKQRAISVRVVLVTLGKMARAAAQRDSRSAGSCDRSRTRISTQRRAMAWARSRPSHRSASVLSNPPSPLPGLMAQRRVGRSLWSSSSGHSGLWCADA